MDLHLSRVNPTNPSEYHQTTVIMPDEIKYIEDDGCENLCEIQLDEYREDNLIKREYAINQQHQQKHQSEGDNSAPHQSDFNHIASKTPMILEDVQNGDNKRQSQLPVDCLSIKFQSDIWPINAVEQREKFFKLGLSPTFKLKGSPEGIEKMINHQNGQIKFNYFYEAKRILDLSLRKFKTMDKFVLHAFGNPITLNEGKERVVKYLKENNLENAITVIWSKHLICSAQMCSSKLAGKKRERQYTLLIKGNHENTFIRDNGIECLLNHEVGTHYLRSYNDTLQVWSRNRVKYGITPIKSYEGMKTEEGLACIHTILHAKIQYLCMPALLYYCSCMAEYLSFKQLFEHLIRYVKNPEQRWKHCMRIKRILKTTSDVGGYGKDQRYFEGAVEILRNIDRIDFKSLIGGKIIWRDLDKVEKLLRRKLVRIPNFMMDYGKYITQLKEIAYLNGLTSPPEPKFKSTSRREVMETLGITEDQLRTNLRKASGKNNNFKTGHRNSGSGDSEKKLVKICGCSLYNGINYDVHLDFQDPTGTGTFCHDDLDGLNVASSSNNGSSTNPRNKKAKKRQVPIVFELDMRKPLMQ